jgi:isopenicillin N synthase-like dioxygenase
VSYVPGAIIVNSGEWLTHLSNGRFVATPHRVTAPPCERISLPLFFNPGDHAVNDPAPGILESGEERKFPRMTWHQFFVGFIDRFAKPAGPSAAN